MSRRKVRLFSVILAVAALFAGCGKKNQPLMQVDEIEYSVKEAQVLASAEVDRICEVYGTSFSGTVIGETTMQTYTDAGIYDSVRQILMMAAAAKSEGITLSESQQEAALACATDYESAVKNAPSSEILQQTFEDYTLARIYLGNIASVAEQSVSAEDCRVMQGKQIRVNFKDSEEKTEAWETITKVKARLDNGKTFQSMVAFYNEVPETRLTFVYGDAESQWQKDLFDLKDGEISQIIELDDGFMIFKCLEATEEELTAKEQERRKEVAAEHLIESTCQKYMDSHQVWWDDSLWDQVDTDVPTGEEITFWEIYERYYPQ